MIPILVSQLAENLSAGFQGDDVIIDTVCTDSRMIAGQCLFVALRGERFDAHDFVPQAQAAGALAVVVDHPLQTPLAQIIVPDTRKALGHIAGWLRARMPAKVVALTGSSGKTSVKEMTAAILGQCGETLFTEGNLNNDIGVPFTLLRLTPQHQFAVIELGASHTGEITWTASITQPQTALVNNLALAHLAGFGSPQGVAQAKGEIFDALPADGIAIINDDSHDLACWRSRIGHRTLWRFAPNNPQCDFHASQIYSHASGSHFTLHTPAGAIVVHLPLAGQHNIANALAAAALAQSVGAPLSAIARGLSQVRPVPGRLYPVKLAENQLLIDDSYNANVGSMCAAIELLATLPGYRLLVAGDMAELGDQAIDCHRQAGQAAGRAMIDEVCTLGTLSAELSNASGVGRHFADKPALLAHLRQRLAAEPVVSLLVKGSRSAAMEQVVQALRLGGDEVC